MDEQTLVRMKEKVEVLTGERGAGNKPEAAVRRKEIDGLMNATAKSGENLTKTEQALTKQIEQLRVDKLGRNDKAASALFADRAQVADLALKAESTAYATASGNAARVGGFLPGELRQTPFCEFGGTASAILLTPVGPIAAILAQGDEYRIRPTFTNNQWASVKLGTLTAMQLFTSTGVVAPNGYLRPGMFSTLTLSITEGAYYASREPENGTSGATRWTKLSDGRITADAELSDDFAAGETKAIEWALPAGMLSPRASALPIITSATDAPQVVGVSYSTGKATFYVKNPGAAATVKLSATATGTWY